MSNLVVFCLCEESQRITEAFRNYGKTLGVDIAAYSCDILPTSGSHPEWHIQGDCLPFLNGLPKEFVTQDGKRHYLNGKPDLLTINPPCTFLAASSGCRLYRHGKIDEERWAKGVKAKEFFESCLNANCGHIMVENPTQLKCFNIRQCDEVIQPWMWGGRHNEFFSKRTCLWTKNLPRLKPDYPDKPNGVRKWVAAGNLKPNGERLADVGIHRSAKLRSKTFFGIASIIAETYTNHLLTLPPSGTAVEDLP